MAAAVVLAVVVGYSQHGEGVRRDWKTAPKRGLRPIAFIALGSRVPGGEPAAYSATGPQGPAFHEQWRAPVAEVLSWRKG